MNAPAVAPLQEEMPDGPFLRTLLMFLARADGPMSGGGWWFEPLTLDDIKAAVHTYSLASAPINAAIAAETENDAVSTIEGLSVGLFNGRIELAIDGSVRTLLTPGRKASVYLEELSIDQVAGGFRLYSSIGLELNIDRADAEAVDASSSGRK